jgi:hypothetical protein
MQTKMVKYTGEDFKMLRSGKKKNEKKPSMMAMATQR